MDTRNVALVALMFTGCFDGESGEGQQQYVNVYRGAVCTVYNEPSPNSVCTVGKTATGWHAEFPGPTPETSHADRGQLSDLRDWCCQQGATLEQAAPGDSTECLGSNPCPGPEYTAPAAYCRQTYDPRTDALLPLCDCGPQADVDLVMTGRLSRVVSSCSVPVTIGKGQEYCCDTHSGLCVCYIRPATECAQYRESLPEQYRDRCP